MSLDWKLVPVRFNRENTNIVNKHRYLLFLRLLLSFVSIERMYQTLKTVFHWLSNISNFVKNTPLRVVFSTLFSVFA